MIWILLLSIPSALTNCISAVALFAVAKRMQRGVKVIVPLEALPETLTRELLISILLGIDVLKSVPKRIVEPVVTLLLESL